MEFLRGYQTELLLGVLALAVIELLIIFSLNGRVARTSRLLRQLLTGPTGENLEELLNRCREESQQALARSDELQEQLGQQGAALREQLERQGATLQGCVQKVGLVRFDAYGDVRGEQSFSLALLDGQNYGTVVTALFGRNDSRFFGKSIRAGQADQTLTEEEENALQMALQGGIGALPSDEPGAGEKRRAGRRARARQEQAA